MCLLNYLAGSFYSTETYFVGIMSFLVYNYIKGCFSSNLACTGRLVPVINKGAD